MSSFFTNQAKLRIKAISLAEEARIIKRDEAKLWKKHMDEWSRTDKFFNKYWSAHWQLNHHRRHDIRIEARATNLARAFLRGKPPEFVEPIVDRNQTYVLSEVRKRFIAIVTKYHHGSRVFENIRNDKDRKAKAAAWFDNYYNRR